MDEACRKHAPRLEWREKRCVKQLIGEQIPQWRYLPKPNQTIEDQQQAGYGRFTCREAKSQLDLFDGDRLNDYVIEWTVATIGSQSSNLVDHLAAGFVNHITKYGVLAV